MSTTPLFSVLIANYNNGQYIKEAIESVKAQDYNNWEIIIVDDNSTDNSKEIYNDYSKDHRINTHYNTENKGVTYTKWKCIEYANGDICGFLDADDALLPNALSIMVHEHLKDKNISIISSRHHICNEQMQFIRESESLRIPEGESYLTHMHYGPNHFVSFKRNKYKQTKGLNPQNKIGDDQELYLLLEEVGTWKVIGDFTYKYRIRNNSLSHIGDNKCMYWNLIIYHEACMRRGINPENCSYKIYQSELKQYAAKTLIDEFMNNKIYKLGLVFYKPFTCLKNIFKCLYK